MFIIIFVFVCLWFVTSTYRFGQLCSDWRDIWGHLKVGTADVAHVSSFPCFLCVMKALILQGALCTRTTGWSGTTEALLGIVAKVNSYLMGCFFCFAASQSQTYFISFVFVTMRRTWKPKCCFFYCLKKRYKLTCTGCCWNYFIVWFSDDAIPEMDSNVCFLCVLKSWW